MRLQPADDIYAQIRDLNFSEVGKVLHGRVRALDATYGERHTDDRWIRPMHVVTVLTPAVSKLRAFVAGLGSLQAR